MRQQQLDNAEAIKINLAPCAIIFLQTLIPFYKIAKSANVCREACPQRLPSAEAFAGRKLLQH